MRARAAGALGQRGGDAEDQAQLASITQANGAPSVWIGLNDIESGKHAPNAAVIPAD